MDTDTLSILADWEKQLAPRVHEAQLQLLGELDISDDLRKRLGQLIGELYRLTGNLHALDFFRRKTPCTFAVFLVAQGVFGYQGGDYWHDVRQTVGVVLDANQQGDWGQTFEGILQELSKPLFEEIKGHRYLKMILAHGGIPDYCLPDFFKHLLQPAITRSRYTDLDTPDLIEELLERSATSFADKPVRRFLQYGGRVAENFFERCCVMAREFIESEHIPDPDEVGLPKRIVEAYRQWTRSQTKITRSVESDHELRFRKPEFIFNPWNGFAFKLPPQSIPREFSQSAFAWRIRWGDETQTVALSLRRGFDQRTTERDFQISYPAQAYEVSFVIDGQVRRTWRFEGISPEKPIMFFEANSGLWQRPANIIPPERLWLAFPKDGLFEWEGIAQPVNLPECFGGWTDYNAQEVDLTQVSRFTLRHAGRSHSWSVGADEDKFKPHFVGGVPFAIPQPSRRAMLYVGEPPAIRIPLSGKYSPKDELENWRITIRSREATLPLLRVLYYRLTELNPLLDEAQHFSEVRLNLPNLLGHSPCGTYDIQLRGPLGRDTELPLRIWQGLSIESLPPVCWPDPAKGPLEISIPLTTDSQDKITCPKEDGRVESVPDNIPQTVRRHTVYAYPNTSVFHLTLSRLTPSGDISIPLEIPVPRPRWLLRDEASQTMLPEWSAYVLHESLDILNQMTAPALWLSMPVVADDFFQVQLRLTPSGNAPVSAWEKRQPEQRQWRFSLLQFRDDLRASRESVLRFELACIGLLERNTELITPILSVTQKLQVENIGLQLLKNKDQFILKLTWREPKQRLRSVTQ